jgi:hypothetical protein
MESSILLAFLTHKLNLTPKKLATLDQFYPTIQDAVADNFAKINPAQQKWVTRWNEAGNYLEALKKFEDAFVFLGFSTFLSYIFYFRILEAVLFGL